MTKKNQLTAERLRALLQYSSETGEFTWLTDRNNRNRRGAVAGRVSQLGYVQIGIDGARYSAHRLAYLFVYGEWPAGDLDHIDQNKLNNRIANLRVASKCENQQNRPIHKNNKSGFKGVFWHTQSGKWAARIGVNGKQRHIGVFDDPEVAYKAYCESAARFHTHNPDAALGAA